MLQVCAFASTMGAREDASTSRLHCAGVPAAQRQGLYLVYSGSLLKEERMLSDYDVLESSTVDVMLRLRHVCLSHKELSQNA